jgi:hypothetical protein
MVGTCNMHAGNINYMEFWLGNLREEAEIGG